MKLEPDVIIPFGMHRRYLQRYDENFMGKEEEINDFDLEIPYPPIDYENEFFWREMSYNQFTENSLSWNYDEYSCGDWNMN